MRILETDNWSVLLPPEWHADRDDEGVLISDRDGVGCLELTALRAPSGTVTAGDVQDIAGDAPPLEALTVADYPAWYRCFDEDGAALREWFVAAGGILLYITYSCDAQHRGLDDAAVDAILATLSVASVS